MTVKKTYGFTEAQAEWITTKTGEMGFSVRDLIEMLINDITGDKEPDDPERADMAKKWFERLSAKYYEETFLTYLFSLSDFEMREFIDCLLFLKQMKDEIEKTGDVLRFPEEGSIADMHLPDLGLKPDDLCSAVDVVVKAFDAYCRTYEVDDADINEEMKKVLDWLAENESRFQQIN